MSTFGKCSGGGRRSAAREVAPLVAVFTTLTQSHAVTLVDVSATGARLRGDFLPRMAEELLLSVEGVRTFGHVVWSESGECGVEFDEPLQPAAVEELRTKVARSAGLRPDWKAAMDDWMLGFAR